MKSFQEKLKSLEQEAMKEEMKTTTEKIRQEMLKHPSPAIAQVVMYDQGKCDVINAAKPIVEELASYAMLVCFAAIFAWTIVNLNRE